MISDGVTRARIASRSARRASRSVATWRRPARSRALSWLSCRSNSIRLILHHRDGDGPGSARMGSDYSSMTGFDRVPMPVIVTSTVSPGCSSDRRRPGVADAARGAGRDHVARLERGPDRGIGDQLGDGVDHVLDRRVLDLLAVDRRASARRWPRSISSGVTIHGPNEPERSKFLPAVNCDGVALVVADRAVHGSTRTHRRGRGRRRRRWPARADRSRRPARPRSRRRRWPPGARAERPPARARSGTG